jgi:hypothetical protein
MSSGRIGSKVYSVRKYKKKQIKLKVAQIFIANNEGKAQGLINDISKKKCLKIF